LIGNNTGGGWLPARRAHPQSAIATVVASPNYALERKVFILYPIITLPMHYNVIIIGAGPAGLSCAQSLADSKLSIAVIEKGRPWVKPCAEGITEKDLERVPRRFIRRGFKEFILHDSKAHHVDFGKEVMWTMDRAAYGRSLKSGLEKRVDFIEAEALAVDRDKVHTSRGDFTYGWLVGADGSNSLVRRYLDLPSEKTLITLQYRIRQDFARPEIHLAGIRGYFWIFPNKGYASVGCGTTIRYAKGLNSKFKEWLSRNKIHIGKARLEGSMILYDYKGMRFGNIILVGDAAGLASGLTGEGIYAAMLSGKQAALVIQGKEIDLMKNYLRKKRIQEKILARFIQAPDVMRPIATALSQTAWGREKAVRLCCKP
jgi:flavin-dependent dehydrogenase